MKIKEHKNGAYVTFEKENGWYHVQLRAPNGELHDKVRCDTYSGAMDYWRAFNAIGKNNWRA